MAASMIKNVDLGFVEKTEKWRLLSHLFPCKVGGKAAWLSLNPLPSTEQLQCSVCGNPCIFLLQIYAPADEVTSGFHRTLFVFICQNPKCCIRNDSSNIKVFRSQLKRKNDFYSEEPPAEMSSSDAQCASQYQPLCVVCGNPGPKRCSKCQQASYCSKLHQTLHWKQGHKHACGKEGDANSTDCNVLFPEQEIVIESEELDEDTGKSEEERLQEYEEFVKRKQPGEIQISAADKDLENMAMSEAQTDRTFAKFKQRIESDPDQVLRYQRGGEPLWVSDEGRAAQVPPCQCGAQRQFEFQILPQLLVHLNVDSVGDSLDWGTLAVYTCSRHCDPGNAYIQEYVCKQDVSNTDIGKK